MSPNPVLRYLGRRGAWYLLTLLVAVALTFVLPRLGPSNPVDAIMTKLSNPSMDSQEYLRLYERYMHEFNLDKPVPIQFLTYLGKALRGDLGVSFARHPQTVNEILAAGLPWTLALQVPALVLAWIVGNLLGAYAAYRRGIFDKGFYPVSLLLSSIPQFCLAILLVFLFGIAFPVLPAYGGYAVNLLPDLSLTFFSSVIEHYPLPFLSVFLVLVGGQAIGMRSMSIYELGTDYVKYAKMMGIRERRIVQYVFRNAMLPQLTGLALALGAMVGGALIVEMVFSYPGLGMVMFNAILGRDYPVIQGCALLVTVGVLAANFIVDILIGVFDPRIRAAQETGAV